MKLRDNPRRLARAITRRSIAEWRRYNIAGQDGWRDRVEEAVDLWLSAGPASATGPLTVSDFGAGNESLGRFLSERAPYPVVYRPYDLYPQRASTARLDVRDGLPAGTANVAFVLGLIEYVPEADPILNRLRSHAEHVVLSYVPLDEEVIPRGARRDLGWVRHQTSEEIEAGITDSGMVELSRRTIREGTTELRLLRSSHR